MTDNAVSSHFNLKNQEKSHNGCVQCTIGSVYSLTATLYAPYIVDNPVGREVGMESSTLPEALCFSWASAFTRDPCVSCFGRILFCRKYVV